MKGLIVLREKNLPTGHPDIASSLKNLAGLYREQKRYAEAEELEARAESIRAKHAEAGGEE